MHKVSGDVGDAGYDEGFVRAFVFVLRALPSEGSLHLPRENQTSARKREIDPMNRPVAC